MGVGQALFFTDKDCESCGFYFGDETGSNCLTPSPVFQYRYQRGGSLSVGASFRAALLIVSEPRTAVWFAPTLMFDCGWST